MKSLATFLCALLAVIQLVPARAATPATNPAPTAPAAAPSLADLLPDTTIAKGTGFEIKQSQLDRAMLNKTAAINARGDTIPPQEMSLLEKQTLNELILVQILNGQANDAEKKKGAEDAGKAFDEIKKRVTDPAMLAQQLKLMKLTPESLLSGLTEEWTFQAVLHDKVSITDDQIKKYYDEHPSVFEMPQIARVTHILFATIDLRSNAPLSEDDKAKKKKLAEDSLKRAKGGEDFGKLAKELSDDPRAKDNSGDIELARGLPNVPPEFEAAAFGLKAGQISEVVTSQLGYHIIKLREMVAPRKRDLAESSSKIKDYLENVEVAKLLPQIAPKLKEDAHVEILDPRLKKLMEDTSAPNVPKSDPPKDIKPGGG